MDAHEMESSKIIEVKVVQKVWLAYEKWIEILSLIHLEIL